MCESCATNDTCECPEGTDLTACACSLPEPKPCNACGHSPLGTEPRRSVI